MGIDITIWDDALAGTLLPNGATQEKRKASPKPLTPLHKFFKVKRNFLKSLS